MIICACNTAHPEIANMLFARIAYNKVWKEEVFTLKQGSLNMLYAVVKRALDGSTHKVGVSSKPEMRIV